MADLQQGGIELIVKGFQKFMSSVGQVNKSYDTMNKASTNASKAVTRTGQQIVDANRRVDAAMRNLHKALLADSAAWHKVEIARVNAHKAQEKGGTAEKLATERLTIANKQYTSTLESMRNARDRVTAAQEAAQRAQEANSQAMQGGVAAGTQLATVMKTVGVVIAGVGIVLAGVTAAWHLFSKAVGVVMGVVQKFVDIIKSAANAIGDFINRTASVVAGLTIFAAFRAIGDAVRNLTAELGSAVSYFQKLNIQLEALAARDISHQFGIPTAQAFTMVGDRAKQLTDWITQLAVKTPFTAKSIAETLAMANAMGLTIGMSKEMTQATIDFTSAMGLSEDHMFRIIYNFGQMLAQGKLNGREFRDLANSFVPVWEILRRMGEAAGKTTAEMKKLAFEGGVPVQAFFEEFIKMAEEDFAGAAGKMARTLEGVTNNLRDFIQIILGTKILGPVAGEIAGRLADMLDVLLGNNVRNAADVIGKVLLHAFKEISGAVDGLTTALGGLAKAFGFTTPTAQGFAQGLATISVGIRRLIEFVTRFITDITTRLNINLSETSKNAATWGYNIVAMLAKGMAAAVNLIVGVINVISRILSFFFKPGSPPRIAPNLDKWGAEAMTEYMKGWLNFDLSVFGDIASKIEGFLRSIPGGIGKDNVGLVPAILGSRAVIADTINKVRDGLISVGDAANLIISRVGKLTSEFRSYITALFEVERVQKLVADAAKAVAAAQLEVDAVSKRIKVAQDEQNAVTERYTDILKDLHDQLTQVTEVYDENQRIRQIDLAISTGLLTAAERERLEQEKKQLLLKQQIRSTEEERDTAVDAVQEKIDALEAERLAAEMRLEASQAAEEAAQAQVDAAQAQLEAAEALVDIQIDQNNLIQEQLDLLEKLAKAAAGAGGGAEAIDWEDLLDLGGQEDVIQTERDLYKKWITELTQKKAVSQMFTDAETAMDNFSKSLDNIGTAFAPLTGEGGALDKLSGAVSGLLGLLGPSGESAVERAFRFEHDQVSTIEKLGMAIQPILESLKTFPWDKVGESLVILVGAFADLATKVDWIKVGTDIANFITDVGKILTLFAENGEVQTVIFNTMLNVWGFIKFFLKLITFDFDGAAKEWVAIFQRVYDQIVKHSIVPDMMNDILTEVDTKMSETTTVWETAWGKIKDFLADPVGVAIQSFIDDKIAGIQTAVDTLKKEYLEPFGVWLRDTFGPIITTFKEDVLEPLALAWDAVSTAISGVIGWIGELVTAITTLNITKILQLLHLGGGEGKQHGGPVSAGHPYMTGERGREMFTPMVNGFIWPNWFTERMMSPQMAGGGGDVYNYNIEMNPTYKNVESEASIRYDLSAALAAARR